MAKKKTSRKSSSKPAPKSDRTQAKESVVERDTLHLWNKDAGLSPAQLKNLRYIVLGLALIMSVLSTRVGLNGDDDVQARYSSDLPSFYMTFGNDTSCFASGPEIKYYGALFELVTGATNQLFGFDKLEPRYYTVRHIWNAIFGCIAMYFLALLVGEVAGFQASILSLLLIFFTMRFLGHSLFNPKDIPFAAGYMVSIYYIYRCLKSLPKVSWATLAGLAVGIMMSIGIRIGGILVIGYLGLALAFYFLYKHGFKAIFSDAIRPYSRAFFVPSVLGTVGALLVWPFGLVSPFQNIPAALEAFSNFQYAIKVLFEGRQVWSSEIPVKYLLTWMGLTMPVFTLLGILLFIAFSRSVIRRYNVIPVILCFFTFAFPIVYVLASGSILYDGWRHFLFTYPPLVFLVTLAWHTLINRFKERKWHYVVWGLLMLTMIDSITFLVRNSTFPYIYFNPIAGGIKGAYGIFELDYWGASIKQAVEALEDEGIISSQMQDTVTIASNFSHPVQVYTRKYKGMVKVNYVRWRQRYDQPWDYGIFVNRFVDGSYLQKGYWPTSKTIKSINANGRPIAIIEKEGVNSDGYRSAVAVTQQNWDEVIFYADRETKAHPDNEMAWINLGMGYLNRNQFAEARVPLERALEIVPENQNALNFMGYYYFVTGNLNDAYATFIKAIDLHITNGTAYYYLGRIEYDRGNYMQAIKFAKDGIDGNPGLPLCYQLASESYRAIGDQANAKRYQDVFDRLTGR